MRLGNFQAPVHAEPREHIKNYICLIKGVKNMPLNPVDAYVGSRLKIRRNELGINQAKTNKMISIIF